MTEPCPYCGGDESKCDFDWRTDRCSQMPPETRIIVCPTCGGDGGWCVERSFDPFSGRIGYGLLTCGDCDGAGEYEIELEPIEMEDLEIGDE